MLKGTTESGFSFEIDDKTLDNYEFVETLAAAEADSTQFVKLVNLLFGDKKQEAFDFVKRQYGYVSYKGISQLVIDIFKSAKDGKNS